MLEYWYIEVLEYQNVGNGYVSIIEYRNVRILELFKYWHNLC